MGNIYLKALRNSSEKVLAEGSYVYVVS